MRNYHQIPVWRLYVWISGILCVLLLCLMGGKLSAWAQEGQSATSSAAKRVLFISSYSYSWETVPKQIAGISRGLGDDYIVNYEFMDTKNTTYSEGYQEYYQLLKYKLAGRDPYDAVIVGDDAAYNFARLYQQELFFEIPIIFEGVDQVDSGLKGREESTYITGIVEQVDYRKNLELAKRLLPDATKLVFILDDAENGVGIQEQIRKYEQYFSDYEVTCLNSSDYTKEEMCRQIAALDASCICFYISMSTGKDGIVYSEEERYTMLETCARIPMFRVSSAGVGKCDILIGGYIASLEKSGFYAGKMAAEALTKGDIDSIPVRTSTPSEYYFNWSCFQKFDLDLKVIPKDATVVNKEPSFLQKNYIQVTAAAGVLIIVLLGTMLTIYVISSRRFARINQTLDSSNRELLSKNEEMEQLIEQTRIDPLTRLYNKEAFEIVVNDTLLHHPDQNHALLFIDLDHFKILNDTLGHLVGDQAICDTADKLRLIFSNYDVLARFGGDEFCVLIRNIPLHTLQDKLDWMMKKLEEEYADDEHRIHITCSCGVAYTKYVGYRYDRMLACADQALYMSKENGRNRYTFYQEHKSEKEKQ